MSIKCPRCKTNFLLYVQNVTEFYYVEKIYDDFIDLGDVQDSVVNDSNYSYCCEGCGDIEKEEVKNLIYK